ncbi:MAG TPA: LytR C-terminal domain-containing protein [Ignavibacteriaceae bacterium]|nr:LytR C-terminal domain-containing protein [Ignavibacteriaceae bacterium]
MKETKQPRKPASSEKFKISNILINVLIGLLLFLVLFFAYNIVAKLTVKEDTEELADKNKPSKIVQLEVLNGCGTSGVADKFTEYLRNHEFDVVKTENYLSFDVENTFVIDRTGNNANAKKVADALGVEYRRITKQLNEDYLLDVSLIIGKDFNKLKPYN